MTLTTKCTSLKLVLFIANVLEKYDYVSKFGEQIKTILESIKNDRCLSAIYVKTFSKCLQTCIEN